MDATIDYHEMKLGPARNQVANAELLDKAGELIISFLKAHGVLASARTLCRRNVDAHPLLMIVTPQDPAPVAIEVLRSSPARNSICPDLDFGSVAVAVKSEEDRLEGIVFMGGQPAIYQMACMLPNAPA